MADLLGWQDHDGDLHEGRPGDLDEAYALRVQAEDDAGDSRWFTILEPFPELDPYGPELDDWITDWLGANGYGEFA